MSTTIFTIESVHGVKQTLVLGPSAKPDGGEEASKVIPVQPADQVGDKDAGTSPAPPR